MKISTFALVGALIHMPLVAQDTVTPAQAPTVSPIAAQPAENAVLRAGTPILLRIME